MPERITGDWYSFQQSTGLLTGCGRKIKIVWDFGGKLCGKKVDCAGNCAGLRNLMTNQILRLQCSSQTRQGGNSV